MSKGQVVHVNFSAYETGITIPAVGTEYTLNGVNNLNFKKYKDAFDDSPTNAFIIKTIVNYIIGDGLIDKKGLIKPHDYLSKMDLRLICLDYKITGSAFPQILRFNKEIVKIKHTPVMRVGLAIDKNPRSFYYMDVYGYYYSWDFTKKFQFTPKYLPKFEPDNDSENIQIMHIKTISSEPFFPLPDWFSGLKSAKIEAALIDDAVNHVLRGFQGKTVINVNNGAMMSEDEKKETVAEVKKNYTGTENSDGVTVSVNDSADEAITVDTIEPRGRNDQFVTYDETAEIKLQAAHSAMNILFQRPGGSGFSNNAEEIKVATDSLYLGVINPIREILLDALNSIFKKISPESDIDFLNFTNENALSEEGEKEVVPAESEAEVAKETPTLDQATLDAQASLKGSVGGVNALLAVQDSYSKGLTTRDSAIAMLDIIFGYTKEQSEKLLGQPKLEETPTV